MMENVKFYSPTLAAPRAWIAAAIFVAGNIAAPQLCHLLPWGGPVLLPIYFFTLVGGYKYGLWVGLLTAAASPVVNHLLFGMPAEAMLAPIIAKGSVLAVAAALAARWMGRVSIWALVGVVLAYQIVGGAAEWAITGSLAAALQDFRIGLPGMAIQVVGGWLVLKAIGKL